MEMNIRRELWLWGLLLGLAALVVRIGKAIWWRPRQIQRHFAAQGITGPSYKLLFGNFLEMKKMLQEAKSKPMELSHRILPRIIPYYDTSLQKYGRIFLYWFGTKPRLYIHDVDLIKEILSTKFGHFGKPPPTPLTKQLGGDGLAALDGQQWAKHRRIINPAFHVENLKGMIPTLAKSAADMLRRWNERVGAGDAEIEVSKEFSELTADVIARTAFGSSYVAGKNFFEMQSEQAMLFVEASRSLYIPGFRFLPTNKNIRRWKVDKEIIRSLKMLINKREQALSMGKSKGYGSDLLGIMMATNKQEPGTQNTCMAFEEIIDECKTFFFTGHETTAVLLTWTMVLLGMHQEWQEAARKEVLDMCGKSAPNSDNINRLKIVTMILNESLRLYPPAVLGLRHTYKEMQLGDFTIPAGTELLLPTLAIHHDSKLWGNDADEFRPQRFAEGVANAAKHPLAFMPFSFGPRICIGLNFAMIEAKLALAMILQQFSFLLSPSYSHAPATLITLKPQFGAQIIVSQL